MNKQIKLYLHNPGAMASWEVASIKNSAEYDPGQILDRKQVEALVNDRKWSVTITRK